MAETLQPKHLPSLSLRLPKPFASTGEMQPPLGWGSSHRYTSLEGNFAGRSASNDL